MAFIVRYIKQSDIDSMGRWSGKIPTAEDIEARKSQVRIESEAAAQRIVDMLRTTGHIAAYYEESELL